MSIKNINRLLKLSKPEITKTIERLPPKKGVYTKLERTQRTLLLRKSGFKPTQRSLSQV